MVRGIEQLYQDTADAVSGVLERRLPGGFAQAWIRVEMIGEICRVACFYSPAAQPEIICPLASNAGLVDIFLICDRLFHQQRKGGDELSAISMLMNSDGEYFFELGTGSQRHSPTQACTPRESAAPENSIIETVHYSPGILSV